MPHIARIWSQGGACIRPAKRELWPIGAGLLRPRSPRVHRSGGARQARVPRWTTGTTRSVAPGLNLCEVPLGR
jgi:hypothetical protein